MSDPTVLSRRDGPVGRVILHRPAKLNALDRTMLEGLVGALRRHDDDPDVRVVILSGTARAFAAGADIGTLGEVGAMELYRSGFSEHWDAVAAIRTPIIAAVSGYVLGGGLELALTCDVVMCERSAVFGFPETAIGTIPGAGGTQRLVHAVGKSMAMEMILAGRRLDADEARAAGLVSTISEQSAGRGGGQAGGSSKLRDAIVGGHSP